MIIFSTDTAWSVLGGHRYCELLLYVCSFPKSKSYIWAQPDALYFVITETLYYTSQSKVSVIYTVHSSTSKRYSLFLACISLKRCIQYIPLEHQSCELANSLNLIFDNESLNTVLKSNTSKTIFFKIWNKQSVF